MSDPGIKTCPECAEEIKLEAKVCRYCGTTFSLVRVGYCAHCHKVVATSELGVCVICNSRLIDVRLESEEIAGPTVGSDETGSVPASEAARPVVVPVEESESAEGAEQEMPALSAVAFTEPEPDLEPTPLPPPGPPAGVSWAKPAPPEEPTPEVEEPVVTEEPTPEVEEPAITDKLTEEKAQSPQTAEPSPNDVAERLAAFGRRSISSAVTTPTPLSGPPVAPPPGPPATTPPVVTPRVPVLQPEAEQAERSASAAPPHVDLRPEPATEEVAQAEPAKEATAVPVEGERLGIVPSLAHRIAHPLYQLAAIAVILVWLLEFYWDRSLRGTSDVGSKALSHLAVATYGSGQTLLIAVQVAVVAAICGLLAPTRLLPKGWFRNRKVSQGFTQELKAKLGVKMIYRQKWYLQKMICAFTIWAIALAYFVWGIARESSVELKIGGYVTAVALLVGFVCSALLMTRRTPVVTVDADGRIGSKR